MGGLRTGLGFSDDGHLPARLVDASSSGVGLVAEALPAIGDRPAVLLQLAEATGAEAIVVSLDGYRGTAMTRRQRGKPDRRRRSLVRIGPERDRAGGDLLSLDHPLRRQRLPRLGRRRHRRHDDQPARRRQQLDRSES